MCKIAESNMLLRANADLPAGCKVAVETFRDGWGRMRTGGVGRLEKKIEARGWNFLKLADGALRSGVGTTSQDAIANALSQALRRVDSGSNAVEVERVELTQYPWFFLARVRVYPYRIQAEAHLPASNRAARDKTAPRRVASRRRLPSRAADFFPEFGSVMPMMKGMLTIARVAEVRAH
jgi:hypothetical protein